MDSHRLHPRRMILYYYFNYYNAQAKSERQESFVKKLTFWNYVPPNFLVYWTLRCKLKNIFYNFSFITLWGSLQFLIVVKNFQKALEKMLSWKLFTKLILCARALFAQNIYLKDIFNACVTNCHHFYFGGEDVTQLVKRKSQFEHCQKGH